MADEIIDNIFFAFLMVCYDEFDCSAEKLKQVADRSLFQFDCVEAGSVALVDFAQYLDHEVNFRINNPHLYAQQIPYFGNIKTFKKLHEKVEHLIALKEAQDE